MSQIDVLVATTSPDVMATGIARAIQARTDMHLITGDCVLASEVDSLLAAVPASRQCAVVLVGALRDTNALMQRWLTWRTDVVVVQVDLDDSVRVELRDPTLEPLLKALALLVESVGPAGRARSAHVHLHSVPSTSAGAPAEERTDPVPRDRPLLRACTAWLRALLHHAVEAMPAAKDELHGVALSPALVLNSLGASPTPAREPEAEAKRARDAERQALLDGLRVQLTSADEALDAALASADPAVEPIAAVARVFELGPIELRLMVLALAPELELGFQRSIAYLLDNMTRGVGTVVLYHALLGRARGDLADGGLERWLAFERYAGRQATADEPLRLDPFLAQWLLGDRTALESDPIVRRVLRLDRWPGARLLQRSEDAAAASLLVDRLVASDAASFVILGGDRPEAWRALLELGMQGEPVPPLRVEATTLSGLDVVTLEETATRIARCARLTRAPLVVDLTASDDERVDDALRLVLATLGALGCHAGLISDDVARTIRLLGAHSFELADTPALPRSAHLAAVRAAASGAGLYLTQDAVEAMANRYPLGVDGWEQVMVLAQSRPEDHRADDPRLARFAAASKDVAAEGLSRLAERIEPVFDLDAVVLPKDRHDQLTEIVDNVRLAPHVLDEWKFGEQLPYGRGVAALFHGPSGTGKTMAAIGIARRLGIQLLRLDLSRVVSKYIGDTEKNIDRVFTDAERSGSAILIDEADALLGKRSEVKDAHDRYANIEVAYLLQKFDAFAGLAILATNLRQNLDPAFLRRLRFIVDFPRPDVAARERIWRQCLPDDSHTLDDAAFRQLARRIDLTGGHIRQMTLRAAFLAAAAGERIGLAHIAQAARAELAKLGMPPVELDLSESRRAA